MKTPSKADPLRARPDPVPAAQARLKSADNRRSERGGLDLRSVTEQAANRATPNQRLPDPSSMSYSQLQTYLESLKKKKAQQAFTTEQPHMKIEGALETSSGSAKNTKGSSAGGKFTIADDPIVVDNVPIDEKERTISPSTSTSDLSEQAVMDAVTPNASDGGVTFLAEDEEDALDGVEMKELVLPTTEDEDEGSTARSQIKVCLHQGSRRAIIRSIAC